MPHPLRSFAPFLVLFLFGPRANAQRSTDQNTHLWISALGDHRFAERWSLHTEAHVRRAEFGAAPQQLLLRPAINCHLHPDVLLSLGYSYYSNHRYGAWPIRVRNWEHHLWQQVQLGQRLGRLHLSHRFRMEERYLAELVPRASDPGTYTFSRYAYRSRLRYRVMATRPFGHHQRVEARTWFASAYNEFFFSFGDDRQPDHMQQDRLSGLLGYQWNDHGNVQAGYLLQLLQRPGAAGGADLLERNHTLHLVLTYNLDLRKKKGQAASG